MITVFSPPPTLQRVTEQRLRSGRAACYRRSIVRGGIRTGAGKSCQSPRSLCRQGDGAGAAGRDERRRGFITGSSPRFENSATEAADE